MRFAPGRTAVATLFLGILRLSLGDTELPSIAGASPKGFVSVQTMLDTPKVSPLHHWEFPYVVTAGPSDPGGIVGQRFAVYAQSPGPLAEQTARMLMRLWEFNYRLLGMDHSYRFRKRVVDVYLCQDGEAGGEQRFDHDNTGRQDVEVNTIYLYDVSHFDQLVERAREVAHEYGHATLPPVGGYREPEYWANGYLGEKLYLRWIRDMMDMGKLEPDDAMGASIHDMRAIVAQDVDGITVNAVAKPLTASDLNPNNRGAMGRFLGFAVACYSMLPSRVFGQALKEMSESSPATAPQTVADVLQEFAPHKLHVPRMFQNRAIWLPLGKSLTVEGTKILAHNGVWVKIWPTSSSLRIAPKPAPASGRPR